MFFSYFPRTTDFVDRKYYQAKRKNLDPNENVNVVSMEKHRTLEYTYCQYLCFIKVPPIFSAFCFLLLLLLYTTSMKTENKNIDRWLENETKKNSVFPTSHTQKTNAKETRSSKYNNKKKPEATFVRCFFRCCCCFVYVLFFLCGQL